MTRRPSIPTLMAVGALALLAACVPPTASSPAEPAPVPQALTYAQLVGQWRILMVDGAGVVPSEPSGRPGADHATLIIGAREGAATSYALGGYNGCNAYGADFVLHEGRLIVEPIVSNARSCGQDSPLDRQERRLMAILNDDPAVALGGDGALLLGPPDAPLIEAVRDPA